MWWKNRQLDYGNLPYTAAITAHFSTFVTYVETLSPKLDRNGTLRIKTLPSSQLDYESIGLYITRTLEIPNIAKGNKKNLTPLSGSHPLFQNSKLL